MLEDTDLKIEQYLRGTMSSESVIVFEKLMAENKNLAKKVELQKEFFRHYNEEFNPASDQVKTVIDDLEACLRKDESKEAKNMLRRVEDQYNQKRRFQFPRLIAASFIGLMICILGYLQFSTNLYQDYYLESDMPLMVTRGVKDNLQAAIVIAYKDHKFKKANELYVDYVNSNVSFDENLYIYGGMAFLELNEFDNALIEFQKMTSSDAVDSSKGLWFSALAYIKKKDEKKTKQILNEIVSDRNNFNYQKAVNLLDELE